mmetsp:Transcript_14610/g.45879  ORF Transcript_14610/g.45879 Transcript_14610/m.45879 type:complete len:154 (-) Transcript_14610:65-526(-)
MMTQALKVVLSSSRSTGASVSPLLVARTAPEGKEKQRLAMRKQVSFKTLSKLNSEDGVRELAKVWSGSNGDGEDAEDEPDQGPSPLQQTRSLLLQKKSVSFRLTKDTTPGGRPHRLLVISAPAEDLIRSHRAEEFQVILLRLCGALHCACVRC